MFLHHWQWSSLSASSSRSGFDNVNVENVTVDITSIDEKRTAILDRVWADREQLRAGETVILSAFLRTANGDEKVERFPIDHPG